MTPEGKVKQQVKKLLDTYGAWYFLPVSNGMGRHGVPDFICCHRGVFITIETKAAGKKPTRLQDIEMGNISNAGGVAFVVSGDAGLQELEAALRGTSK